MLVRAASTALYVWFPVVLCVLDKFREVKAKTAEAECLEMSGYPIDLFSGIRYYIDDHERGAFELSAPTTDVHHVTGRPAEDFETIARRYAARSATSGPSATGFARSRSSF